MAVHKSYLAACLPLVHAGVIQGMAHITGGGIPDNVPRVLPDGVGIRVNTGAIPRSPICELIVARGNVQREEAFRVLNMGVGMVLFARPEHSDEVVAACRQAGEDPFHLGEVVKSDVKVNLS